MGPPKPDDEVITINVRAEREKIARARKELDAHEKWLDSIVRNFKGGIQLGKDYIAPGIAASQSEISLGKSPHGLTDGVRLAINSFGNNEFDVPQIESYLQKWNFALPKVDPRGRIAMIVKLLFDNGQIERTYVGSGRTPHRYRVKK